MLFQALDNKKDCFGVYADGELRHHDPLPAAFDKTWAYSSFLSSTSNIDYAHIHSGGLSLSEACPPHARERWDVVCKKLKAYLRSFSQAKISLEEHCFFDLVPERFLVELCEVKNEITEHVFNAHEKPENYEFMKDVVRLTTDIANRSLILNKQSLSGRLGSAKGRSLWKNFDGLSRRIVYNPYGTKTGRLSTMKSSFPILTLAKEHRSIIQPKNDWLVELDFNAAELRTLLALAGEEQPNDDIHIWNVENVYNGKYNRDEAKQKIFAWLYNPRSKDKLANKTYRREDVLKKHWDGVQVATPFGRVIEADQKHALNYLIQSTSSDIFLDRALAIHDYLKNKKSYVSMLIHDSIILDLCNSDLDNVKEMVNIFSQTKFGTYRVGVKAGKNFGDLRKLI